jgi:hypothetical protein
MALELIASLIAAATLGLMAWALRRWFKGLPKWFVSVSAGVGLIGTTVWLEYDWFNRVSAELPAGFAVVDAMATANPLRPWTYLAPITTRFGAVDTAKAARHPQRPEMVIVPVYAFARWQNPQNALLVFDCAGKRRVTVADGVNIDADGVLTGAEWTTLDESDELQQVACKGG